MGEGADSDTAKAAESGAGRIIGSSILLKIYLSFSAWRSIEEEDSLANSVIFMSVNLSLEGLDSWTGLGETLGADPGREDSTTSGTYAGGGTVCDLGFLP